MPPLTLLVVVVFVLSWLDFSRAAADFCKTHLLLPVFRAHNSTALLQTLHLHYSDNSVDFFFRLVLFFAPHWIRTEGFLGGDKRTTTLVTDSNATAELERSRTAARCCGRVSFVKPFLNVCVGRAPVFLSHSLDFTHSRARFLSRFFFGRTNNFAFSSCVFRAWRGPARAHTDTKMNRQKGRRRQRFFGRADGDRWKRMMMSVDGIFA